MPQQHLNWSPWLAVESPTAFDEIGLRETLDGGQAFRWRFEEDSQNWTGVWSRYAVRLRLSDGSLQASFPEELAAEGLPALRHYLGSDIDWPALSNALPWRSDPHLALAREQFSSLRLLQQPFPETLLGFLCSATKQIPQIKLLCEKLAVTLGQNITGPYYRLPTWEAIASTAEKDLRALGLGFRARNIKLTADLLAQEPNRLETIEKLPYLQAKEALIELPGVGEKIADCALLFGAGQLEAFPVDTWILKTLQSRYGLQKWDIKQIAQFGRIHFGQYAGYAQQFLFSFERNRS